VVKTYPIAKLFLCCETIGMFLRSCKRKKNVKWYEYFSVVENHRVPNGKTVRRTVLYLGEITASQEEILSNVVDWIFPKNTEKCRILLDTGLIKNGGGEVTALPVEKSLLYP